MNLMAALPGAHATQAALNAARETLNEAADAVAATYLLLALLLLKIASDTDAAAQDPDGAYGVPLEWPPTAPGAQLLVVPAEARFELLFQQRFAPGNERRITAALQRLTQANRATLAEVFDVLRLHDGWPRDADRRDVALSRLLGRLTVPALDFRSLRGTYRADIGQAVDHLLERSHPRRSALPLAHVPDALGWLMAGLMDPHEDETICDVACHNGSLLLAASRWARATHGARRHQLLGQEEDDMAWACARLRLLLHGEDNHAVHAGTPLLHDTLVDANGQLRCFHVQLARPAFALGWLPERGMRDPHRRYVHGLPPRQWGHLALLQHMLKAMHPHTGRVALVVPHGVLFRDGEEAQIRRSLLDANLIEAVIGLPERLFAGSPVSTALLVLRAVRNDDAVLFVDARRLQPAARRGPKLDQVAAEQVLALCRRRHGVAGVACLATPQMLALHGSSLSIARYVQPDAPAPVSTLEALREQRAQLRSRLGALEQALDGDLAQLEARPAKAS
ncbi:SAM-dependent methyltransferase [Bacillus subtilis subsp. subtilis]|nr:SAM-dependent methyltransferase [Bacillus subtilis subsp. subtilis]